MYTCNHCGEIRETLRCFNERHPVGDGFAGETLWDNVCPVCGCEMIEGKRCNSCGEVKSIEDEDFYEGICESCLKEIAKDLDTVKQCAKLSPTHQKVEVNSFLVYMLHPQTIDEILWDYFDRCCESSSFGFLLRGMYRKKAEKWATDDLDWFSEALSEVKKN